MQQLRTIVALILSIPGLAACATAPAQAPTAPEARPEHP
jgi:hypothetical protein